MLRLINGEIDNASRRNRKHINGFDHSFADPVPVPARHMEIRSCAFVEAFCSGPSRLF